jgi:hypothetical protein
VAGKGGLATEVRTGLDEGQAVKLELIQGGIVDNHVGLERLFHGRPVRQHVREFGAVFGVLFLIFAAVSLYKRGLNPTAAILTVAGIISYVSALTMPAQIEPLWKGWMAVAEKMSVVMTFVILMTAWLLMLVPLAFLLKVLRISVMDMIYGTKKDSYWEDRPERLHDFQLLRRQF